MQLLGDARVGSLASGETDQGYQFLPSLQEKLLRCFVNTKKALGRLSETNDGMLHGFSITGQELFGYFPGAVLHQTQGFGKSPSCVNLPSMAIDAR